MISDEDAKLFAGGLMGLIKILCWLGYIYVLFGFGHYLFSFPEDLRESAVYLIQNKESYGYRDSNHILQVKEKGGEWENILDLKTGEKL